MTVKEIIELLRKKKKEDLTLSFQQMIAVEKYIELIEKWEGGGDYE